MNFSPRLDFVSKVNMLSMAAMPYHLQVWQNCGLWHHSCQPRWYRWYTVFLVIFVYILFPLSIGIQLASTQSVEEFTANLLILPMAAFCIKCSLIAINRPNIVELFEILQEMDKCIRLGEHRGYGAITADNFNLSL